MAQSITLQVALQTNRKVLIVTDISTGIWGTAGYEFDNFVAANPLNNKVVVDIAIETIDGIKNYSIDLTNEGAFGVAGSPITSDKLSFSFVINKDGNVVYINNTTNLSTDYQEFPDGVYTLNYQIVNLNPLTKTNTMVITERADNIIIAKALNVEESLLCGTVIDPKELINELIYESLLFAVNKSAYVGRKQTINKLLNLINNEDYEYYTVE